MSRGLHALSNPGLVMAKRHLLHLPQRALKDPGNGVDLLGGEEVVERDGDVYASGELRNREVALCGAKLYPVEGLKADGGGTCAVSRPRVLSRESQSRHLF